MTVRIYLVAYDISNNKLRNRTVKRLKQTGLYRIQKSVFAGPAFPAEIDRLEQWFRKNIQNPGSTGDSYFILAIPESEIDNLRFITANNSVDWKKVLGRYTVYFF